MGILGFKQNSYDARDTSHLLPEIVEMLTTLFFYLRILARSTAHLKTGQNYMVSELKFNKKHTPYDMMPGICFKIL